jgi:hypothetical protein
MDQSRNGCHCFVKRVVVSYRMWNRLTTWHSERLHMTNFYQAMLSLLVCFVGGVAVLRYLKNFYFPKG